MFTTREKQLLAHATRRVKALFKERPYPAHNFDHADRVRKWAMQIAKAEKANVFLSAFIALIHDIGRATKVLFQSIKMILPEKLRKDLQPVLPTRRHSQIRLRAYLRKVE
jgi:HD superfamily phosphodiesterase